jgi:ubiquinone/menaquinone biosynthesis C-methylase UbiE
MASPNTAAGTTIYKHSALKLYDIVMLKFSNTHTWRCRTASVRLPSFAQNLSQNHLDIGIGTGYYSRQSIASRILTKYSKVTLVDLNPNTLEAAQAQL